VLCSLFFLLSFFSFLNFAASCGVTLLGYL
jgi:hypothetical protein